MTLPFSTLFSKPKINFTVIKPEINLDAAELKSDKASEPIDLSGLMERLNRMNISKGSLKFKSGSTSLTLLDFDLTSANIGGRTVHKLSSPHFKVILPIEDDLVTISGNLNASFYQQRKSIKINLFEWRTENMIIKTSGRIYFDNRFHVRAQIQGTPVELLRPLIGGLAVDGLVYGNADCKTDDKGVVVISARFKSPRFISGEQVFTNLNGTANWDSKDKRIDIKAKLKSDKHRGTLEISSKNADTRIRGTNISAPVISRAIGLYETIPFGGVIKKGNIRIKPPMIKGHLEIADASTTLPEEFPLMGDMQFSFNTRKKEVEFSADKIGAEFGNLTITGDVKLATSQLKIDASAGINRPSTINKYSMFFIDLDLARWKFNNGNGTLKLHLNKNGNRLKYKSWFNFSNMRSAKEQLSTLKGQIAGNNGISTGSIELDDTLLQGKAQLLITPSRGIRVDISDIEGESSKIFRILGLAVPGSGKMTGWATYMSPQNSPAFVVNGAFTSSHFIFGGYNFRNLSGNFASDSNFIDLTNMRYRFRKGSGYTNLFIDYLNKQYDADGAIKDLDASQFHQEFSGKGSAVFSGSGDFNTDQIELESEFNNLSFYKDRPFKASGTAWISTNFEDFRIKGEGNLESNKILSPLDFTFNSISNRYSGDLNLNINDLDLMIPWKNNKGKIKVKGEFFANSASEIDMKGVAEINGKTLSFPNFPHTLNKAHGLILFTDMSNFNLTSLKGEMGKGTVEGNGHIKLKADGLKSLSMNFSGKKMTLYPMHKTRFKLNADLSLNLVKDKLVLSGDLHCLSALWEREFDEGVSFYTDDDISSSETKLYEKLEFDVKIHGNNDIKMVNYYGRAEGKFNLHLTGTKEFPFMTGTIESTRGTFNFQDTKFNLVKAEIIYNNKYTFDPIVRLDSEAFIKNYRIRFTIDGTLSRLKPEFKASPPLPAQDIFALLSMGELFERQSPTQLSSHVGTLSGSAGGTGLISNYWNERLTRSAKKLLGIDLLIKVDPVITGSSVESSSRLTLGWPVTKKVMVVYSTNISTTKQEDVRKEIYYLQYNISPSFSLICMRNEENRFSFDFRFRKRSR